MNMNDLRNIMTEVLLTNDLAVVMSEEDFKTYLKMCEKVEQLADKYVASDDKKLYYEVNYGKRTN